MSNKETEHKQMLTQLVERRKRRNSATYYFFKRQLERIHERGMKLATMGRWEGAARKCGKGDFFI